MTRAQRIAIALLERRKLARTALAEPMSDSEWALFIAAHPEFR